MNNNYILRFNELTQFIEFKHRSLKHIYHSVRQRKNVIIVFQCTRKSILDMCVANCHSCSLSHETSMMSKYNSVNRKKYNTVCVQGWITERAERAQAQGPLSSGGPKPEPLREVDVINFACCQLFLDFVFVNIRSGL